MARMKLGRGGDQLDEIAPGLKLDVHPNVRRITGFDPQVLVTAIAEDQHGLVKGIDAASLAQALTARQQRHAAARRCRPTQRWPRSAR